MTKWNFPVHRLNLKLSRPACLAGCALIAGLISTPALAAKTGDLAERGLFAVVNGHEITVQEYDSFLTGYTRSKAYHGASKEQINKFRVEAGQALIDRRLLLQEADRRGIAGDPAAVQNRVRQYEKKYIGTPAWSRAKKELPRLRAFLLRNSKTEALSAAVRQVSDPGDAGLRQFHEENLKLFTEPSRVRVSAIILKIEPWRDKSFWTDAKTRTEALAREFAAGASFAELAKAHSTHESAKSGGDLGLVHAGGFSKPVQVEIDKLKPGDISPPIRLLEGYGLFRLMERRAARVRDFEDVRGRAQALYKRAHSKENWEAFVDGLRRAANITVNQSLYTR